MAKHHSILIDKVGREAADTLSAYIDEKIETEVKALATKEDLANVKTEMVKWISGFFFTLILAILGLYFRK